MLDKDSLKILLQSLEKLDAGFAALPEFDAQVPGALRVAEILASTSERLQITIRIFIRSMPGRC